VNLPDGTACGHRACLSHKTYPCPFCGRIAGRALTTSERVAKAIEKEFCDPSMDGPREEYFAAVVELIDPIVIESQGYVPIPRMFLRCDTSLLTTEEEAKRLGEEIAADLGTDVSGFSSSVAKSSRPITLIIEEPRRIPVRKNYLKAAWECVKFPFRLVANFLTAMGDVK